MDTNNCEIFDAGDLTSAEILELDALGYKNCGAQLYHSKHYRPFVPVFDRREGISNWPADEKMVTWFFENAYEILTPEAQQYQDSE